MRFDKLKIYTIILLFIIVSGCANHIIHEDFTNYVSRSYTYLCFSGIDKPFIIDSIIGGESADVYKTIAFEGDKFSIELLPIKIEGPEPDDDSTEWWVDVSIYGEGINVKVIEEENGYTRKAEVTVNAMESLFEIVVNAHYYSEFKLKIKQIGKREPSAN